MSFEQKTKRCPVCGATRYFDEEKQFLDDEGEHAPCPACYPLDKFLTKISVYFQDVVKSDLDFTGDGDLIEYKSVFFDNDFRLSVEMDALMRALNELYDTFDTHELFLAKPICAVRGLSDEQIKAMVEIVYDEIVECISFFTREEGGMRWLIAEVKEALRKNPSFKVYGMSPEGKKEAPVFDGLGAVAMADPCLLEAEKIVKEAPSWKERLCIKDGYLARGEDDEPLIHKLSRCVATFRGFNWALNVTICPSYPSYLMDYEGEADEVLQRVVRKVVFSEEDPPEKAEA